MKRRGPLPAVVLAVVIGWAGWWGYTRWNHYGCFTLQCLLPAGTTEAPQRTQRPPYTAAELRDFLDASIRAEALADPLKRCLAFPDPPRSHWSRAAVEAYCRYRTQPVMTSDAIGQLIRDGKAAEVDARLARMLDQQRTDPTARGLLDRTWFQDFAKSSTDLRHAVDAWKHQSPRSAFAFAASGWLYVQAAMDADEDNHASARDNALALARADLSAAQQLDPRLTPTYVGMLRAANLDGDARRGGLAAREGLDADPADYAIWALRMERVAHNLPAMRAVADEARPRLADNPMLQIVLSEPVAEQAGVCGCRGDAPPDAFRDVLDQIASLTVLREAGTNAGRQHLPEISAIYFSEEARFEPDSVDARKAQVAALMALRHRVALQEAAGRLALVDADRLVALHPEDPDLLGELGQDYVALAAFDRAWDLADRLVRDDPKDANGWVLRAQVQFQQPRPGLRETSQYIVDHFRDEPRARDAVEQAQANLAKSPASGP